MNNKDHQRIKKEKNLQHAFIVLLIVMTLIDSTRSKLITSGPKNLLKDPQNYYRVFHGVNIAYKILPYYPPILTHFDYTLSFSEKDAQDLASWGMNFIRLTFYWEAVEPERTQYNQTYISKLKYIVELCDKYNISVLLDLHQDAASRYYCGEGMPDWAVDRMTDFPSPLKSEIIIGEDGYPTLESCLKTRFSKYYWSDAVQQAFQDLYDNKNGIKDAFAEMWKFVASEFKDYENVIGYEILNEPWIGDINKNKLIVLDGGDKNLLPLYQLVHRKIREVDSRTIVFFECAITDYAAFSLTKPPAEGPYLNRLMQSYHIYCSTLGDQKSAIICDALEAGEDLSTDIMQRMWKVGGLMSEFGAISGKPGADIDSTKFLIEVAANKFHSWSYWQFKYYDDYTTHSRPSVDEGFYNGEGALIVDKVAMLARPYAYRICGEPLSTVWKSGTLDLRLRAAKEGACAEDGEGVEEEMKGRRGGTDRDGGVIIGEGNSVWFFLSKRFHFESGFDSLVEGAKGYEVEEVGADRYRVRYFGARENAEVRIKIVAK